MAFERVGTRTDDFRRLDDREDFTRVALDPHVLSLDRDRAAIELDKLTITLGALGYRVQIKAVRINDVVHKSQWRREVHDKEPGDTRCAEPGDVNHRSIGFQPVHKQDHGKSTQADQPGYGPFNGPDTDGKMGPVEGRHQVNAVTPFVL